MRTSWAIVGACALQSTDATYPSFIRQAKASSDYVNFTAVALIPQIPRGGQITPLPVEGISPTLEGLDMNRVRIRLEGLSTYAVVSALMLNGSLRLLSGTPKAMEERKPVDNACKVVFCASILLSILSSVYATVVFSLLGLYCKTALGLHQDQQYLKFMDATAKERKYAFDAFLWSLAAFQSSFVSSLFLSYRGPLRWLSAGAATLLVVWSFRHWIKIMNLAGQLVFGEQ